MECLWLRRDRHVCQRARAASPSADGRLRFHPFAIGRMADAGWESPLDGRNENRSRLYCFSLDPGFCSSVSSLIQKHDHAHRPYLSGVRVKWNSRLVLEGHRKRRASARRQTNTALNIATAFSAVVTPPPAAGVRAVHCPRGAARRSLPPRAASCAVALVRRGLHARRCTVYEARQQRSQHNQAGSGAC